MPHRARPGTPRNQLGRAAGVAPGEGVSEPHEVGEAGGELHILSAATRLRSARTALYTVNADVFGFAASALLRIVSSKLPNAPAASTVCTFSATDGSAMRRTCGGSGRRPASDTVAATLAFF